LIRAGARTLSGGDISLDRSGLPVLAGRSLEETAAKRIGALIAAKR
jgi:hypothetical protein